MAVEKTNDRYQNYCEDLATSYFSQKESEENSQKLIIEDLAVVNLAIDLVITLFFLKYSN